MSGKSPKAGQLSLLSLTRQTCRTVWFHHRTFLGKPLKAGRLSADAPESPLCSESTAACQKFPNAHIGCLCWGNSVDPDGLDSDQNLLQVTNIVFQENTLCRQPMRNTLLGAFPYHVPMVTLYTVPDKLRPSFVQPVEVTRWVVAGGSDCTFTDIPSGF